MRLGDVRRIHLVAAAIARTAAPSRRPRGTGRRSRRVLRRVGQDRDLLEAVLVERLAARADEAVEHARRRDDIGAGARLRRARPRPRFSSEASLSSSPSTSTPQWPWSVYSQKQASSHHDQLGQALLDRADRLLDDAVVVPRLGADRVLRARGCRTGSPPGCRGRGAPAPRHRLVDRELNWPGSELIGFSTPGRARRTADR